MPLAVICNPACGAGDGYTFVRDHVLPVLHDAGKVIDNLIITERAGHAGEVVVDLLKASSNSEQTTLILSSGDGTLHEIINAVCTSVTGDLKSIQSLAIALVPSGTANALFSSLFPADPFPAANPVVHRMTAVRQFLQRDQVVPLTLAKTIIRDGTQIMQEVLSAVVTSTALHASILHDSEALRHTVPDLNRFKLAAAKNIEKWYSGNAKLIPLETGEVLRFDNDRGEFIPESAGTMFKGPFTYFLSTVNVDRLEPQFRITPLQTRLAFDEPQSMDIIMLRPTRNENVQDDEKGRASAVESMTRVLSGAYRDGAHMSMRFSEENYENKHIVEYFRCGGWQWIPDKSDDYAHLLCCDGTIFQIPLEGEATCRVLPRDAIKFLVYKA